MEFLSYFANNAKEWEKESKCETGIYHADLVQRASTDKLKRNATLLSSLRLTDTGSMILKQNEKRKRSELKVATYTASHTSNSSVDHLCKLIRSLDVLVIKKSKCTGPNALH